MFFLKILMMPSWEKNFLFMSNTIVFVLLKWTCCLLDQVRTFMLFSKYKFFCISRVILFYFCSIGRNFSHILKEERKKQLPLYLSNGRSARKRLISWSPQLTKGEVRIKRSKLYSPNRRSAQKTAAGGKANPPMTRRWWAESACAFSSSS